MAGIFDRLKERFTQNAAGTTDLSSLSEDQQKLLRRQYIGRLGSSLAQTGDFGAGMEAQAKDAQARQAEMQAAALQRQRAGYFGESPLNPAQQQLETPVAPPRLLNPASTNQRPGVPSAPPPVQAPAQAAGRGAGPAQGVPPRERFVGAIQTALRNGDTDFAENLRKQVDTLFPMEKFTAKDMMDANGRSIVGLVGDQGNIRSTDYAPRAVARTEELRDLEDPVLMARRMAIENAGANRSTIVNEAEQYVSPFMRALGTEDAKRFTAAGTEATLAGQTLNSLGQLKTTLSDVRTGRIPGMIATAGQFAGTEEGSKAQAAQAMVQDQVVSAMALLKGPATDQDAARIEAMIPNIFMDPRAAQEVFAYLERKAREKQMVFDEMMQHVNTPGNNGLLGFQSSFSRLPEQAAQPAPTGGTNRFDRAGVRRL